MPDPSAPPPAADHPSPQDIAAEAIPASNASSIPTPSLATLAMQLASLYASRATLETALKVITENINAVETQAHQVMVLMGASAFATDAGELVIKPKLSYKATDWNALQEFIATTGEFDLLQRRLSSTALRERGASLPPGVMENWFNELQFSPTATKKGSRHE